jgi:hypothetical protein
MAHRKAPKINAGWLRLQRERFDLDPDYRPPPPLRSVSFSDVLPGVMKSMGLESSYNIADLLPRWPDLIGKTNAQHCRPGRWEQGVLTIYADHSVWLMEIKRNCSQGILKRLRADYGDDAVRELRFQIDPGEENP